MMTNKSDGLSSKQPYQDKTIWITGASSGIGQALAMVLAQQGAKIILTSRREQQLESIRQQLHQPERHQIVVLDLCDEQHVEQAVNHIFATNAQLDMLINNAGISQRASIAETTMATERQIMEIDYFAQVNLTKHVLPYLVKQQYGHIVFMSSIAGLIGTQYRATYSAAKAALHLWANSCRAEYHAKGIDVSVVFPGFVQTNISFNALNGDGEPQQHQDSVIENGLDVDDFAQRVVRELAQKKPQIIIGGAKERMGVLLSRFAPKTLYKVVRKVTVK